MTCCEKQSTLVSHFLLIIPGWERKSRKFVVERSTLLLKDYRKRYYIVQRQDDYRLFVRSTRANGGPVSSKNSL